jgi:hypothetical protein
MLPRYNLGAAKAEKGRGKAGSCSIRKVYEIGQTKDWRALLRAIFLNNRVTKLDVGTGITWSASATCI